MACGDQRQWGYRWIWPDRPLYKRWSDQVDPVKEFGKPRKGFNDYYNERLMEFYRNYPDRPEDLYHYYNEQQTKEAMTKFKKGDRVRVTSIGSQYQGCEGVVTDVQLYNRYEVGLDGVGLLNYSVSCLELVDQPLSTTPDKVLQAAKTSPQAKDALKALFPDVFKDEPLEFSGDVDMKRVLYIGTSFAPVGLDNKCLIVYDCWEMKTQQHSGRTILTFHKKP